MGLEIMEDCWRAVVAPLKWVSHFIFRACLCNRWKSNNCLNQLCDSPHWARILNRRPWMDAQPFTGSNLHIADLGAVNWPSSSNFKGPNTVFLSECLLKWLFNSNKEFFFVHAAFMVLKSLFQGLSVFTLELREAKDIQT